MCSSYAKKYGLPIIILRPTMVYGTKDDDSQIQKMVNFIKRGFFPVIGNGKNNVPMIYISNAVDAIVKGALKGKPGNIYYITADERITMNELVDTISEKLGVKVFKIKIPVFIAYTLAAMLEVLGKLIGKDLDISRRRILSMSSDRIFDISKAKRDFGFSPKISVDEGISRAVKNYGVR